MLAGYDDDDSRAPASAGADLAGARFGSHDAAADRQTAAERCRAGQVPRASGRGGVRPTAAVADRLPLRRRSAAAAADADSRRASEPDLRRAVRPAGGWAAAEGRRAPTVADAAHLGRVSAAARLHRRGRRALAAAAAAGRRWRRPGGRRHAAVDRRRRR